MTQMLLSENSASSLLASSPLLSAPRLSRFGPMTKRNSTEKLILQFFLICAEDAN